MEDIIYSMMQLILIGLHSIILIYTFIKKRGYLNTSQQALVVITSMGFILLEIYFLQNSVMSLGCFSIFRDLVVIASTILIISLIHKKEQQQEVIIGLKEYKKVYDLIPLPVNAVRLFDNKIVYANRCFIETYGLNDPMTNEKFWGNFSDDFNKNNFYTCNSEETVKEVIQKINDNEKKKFIKYCTKIEGIEYVFTIQKEL